MNWLRLFGRGRSFLKKVIYSQYTEHDSNVFVCIHMSYVLFDTENSKIIYVYAFEEGTKSEWRTACIPEKYLPKDLIDLIK